MRPTARICTLLAFALLALARPAWAFVPIGLEWPEGSVHFRINPNFPVEALAGTPDRQIEVLLCAADAWTRQTHASFEFLYDGTTNRSTFNQNDGVNIMAWSSSDGGDALAATLINGRDGRASTFDILFFKTSNGAENTWTTSGLPGPGELDLVGAATHELGHALGLNHTPIPQATMFAAITGRGLPLRTLHADDRDGVESLYGVAARGEPEVSLDGISPAEGPVAGGSAVLITGNNFTYLGDTVVKVDGVALETARFTVENCDRITIHSMPPHGAGTVDVQVTNTLGGGTKTAAYRYVGDPPVVSAVNPGKGPTAGGITVEISGSGFTPDAVGFIGSSPLVDNEVVSGTLLRGRLPPGAAGTVEVSVHQGEDATVLAGAFTYNAHGLRFGEATGVAGAGALEVPVLVTSPAGVNGATFGFHYDPALISVHGATVEGSAAGGAEVLEVGGEVGAATVRLVVRQNAAENQVPPGEGVLLLRVLIAINASAPAGTEISLTPAGDVGSPALPLSLLLAGADPVEPLVSPGGIHVLGGPVFLRADANNDDQVDLSDPVFLLDFLFKGGVPPVCRDATDANDDGEVDISDAVRILNFLFQGNAPPPSPYPDPGTDPTPDGLDCGR